MVYLATQARHPAHLSCRQSQDHNPCLASCVSSAKVTEPMSLKHTELGKTAKEYICTLKISLWMQRVGHFLEKKKKKA